jgi:hypothetical protein
MRIQNNGDISFYEDTGTTAKFFWDASAESLGIGTSSPSAALHVIGDPFGSVLIDGTDSIRPSTDDSLITISGGNATNSGANYTLFGGTHPTLANIHRWRVGGSEAMRIDSSGNVGIGTSSPSVKLHTTSGVARTSTAKTETAFFATDDIDDYRFGLLVSHKGGATGADRYASIDSTSYRLSTDTFSTGGSLVLQQLGGNVGIGTSSPVSLLHVEGTDDVVTRIKSTGSNSLARLILQNDGRTWAIDNDGANSDALTFYDATAVAERMRIDSSGNLLVGKTSTSFGTEGQELRASGQTLFTRDSAQVLSLNLKTADGDILGFYKNGTTVGSIGVNGGTNLTIGTGSTGLIFNDNFDTIYGVNVSTNATLDGTIDLGYPTKRFKDLYLSGGVYLGGTGSANKLDDYEEGTWTPVVDNVSGFDASTISSITARYTKIGRQVTLEFEFALPNSTGSLVAGDDIVLTSGCLPFTPLDGGHATGTFGFQTSMSTGEDVAMAYAGFSSDFKLGILFHTIDGTVSRSTVGGGIVTYFTS